ncbi:unnamed protein product [Didymodactylos carnosus]|uniref:Reverse transcriptase domain-containing protein n=1 Tax=Didymodactylos carnosus TaxID=1234261 RepID=A0A8S2FCW7_9BILA|nr:unnamed protein product [Didymodactylos carnosus]CAF4224543.1 unnamed protein product [Didymodactylos carnosus]
MTSNGGIPVLMPPFYVPQRVIVPGTPIGFGLTTNLLSSTNLSLFQTMPSPVIGVDSRPLLSKKGDLRDPNNWRGITLLSIPGKVLCGILADRIRSAIEKVLREEQAGFRPNRRQRCILSPLLFIIAIDRVLQKALKDQKLGVKLNYKQEIEDLNFADDIVLIADNTQKMQEKTDRIDTHSKSIGLKINAKKTNIMAINENKFGDDVEIMVNNNKLAQAQEFMYLGSKISQSGDIMIEINNRIAKAAYALKALNKVWQNKGIPLKTKI